MYATGSTAVVVPLSSLGRESDNDEVFKTNIQKLLSLTGKFHNNMVIFFRLFIDLIGNILLGVSEGNYCCIIYCIII